MELNDRFKIENVIFPVVPSNETEQSRDQTYAKFTPIFHELRQLKYGRYLNLTASNNKFKPLQIFLLAACVDN
ncbi:unnamed protein product [Rotaria sp. Silwood2]|nr:unnamed protein product [Rotaria sp. Silwood2]CAF3034598.1 unnamed protein product [Rotaria sp. Silwood2]CAF3224605.1 unnamed protein product [Rotaria sp. Silwood2]CAF3384023.1 unnamed protein product [Rotaria sp. Silwood2]CAF4072672.1 unnamed protein product [Rotaria sp. Silwood2]